MLRETAANPRAASQTTVSVGMINVNVHDSTTGKRLNKCGLFGRVDRRKLLTKKEHVSTVRLCKVASE